MTAAAHRDAQAGPVAQREQEVIDHLPRGDGLIKGVDDYEGAPLRAGLKILQQRGGAARHQAERFRDHAGSLVGVEATGVHGGERGAGGQPGRSALDQGTGPSPGQQVRAPGRLGQQDG
jgi:hypothetical protein